MLIMSPTLAARDATQAQFSIFSIANMQHANKLVAALFAKAASTDSSCPSFKQQGGNYRRDIVGCYFNC